MRANRIVRTDGSFLFSRQIGQANGATKSQDKIRRKQPADLPFDLKLMCTTVDVEKESSCFLQKLQAALSGAHNTGSLSE